MAGPIAKPLADARGSERSMLSYLLSRVPNFEQNIPQPDTSRGVPAPNSLLTHHAEWKFIGKALALPTYHIVMGKLGIIAAITLVLGLPGTLLQAAAVVRVDGVFGDSLVGDADSGHHFVIEGRSPAACKICYAGFRKTNPHEFRAMRIPLLKGRLFNERDAGVAVINQSMARRYWPGQNPVGRRFRFARSGWLSIVGVVGDFQPDAPEAFLPVGGGSKIRID